MNLTRLKLYLPKWVEMLPTEHPVKDGLICMIKEFLKDCRNIEEIERIKEMLNSLDFVQNVSRETEKEETEETAAFRIEVDDAWYYQMLSELAGIRIEGEYQLISMVKELSALKEEYEKARDALEQVRSTGYGVITPEQAEIRLEEPVVIRQGGKFGVKLKAVSPSIHLIRAQIETEIAPIVGNEQQANDLMTYIQEASHSEEGIWETNIFGKSIEEMTEDGINSRLSQITEESQKKLQLILQRIINEGNGGFICIII